jgi:hypothetical protein
MSLSKERYNRAKVLFNAIDEKEEYASFLFKNKDTFPTSALHVLNLIDRDIEDLHTTRNGLFAGYIDILGYRRRSHDLYPNYKQHMDNHLMFLFLKERCHKWMRAIVVLVLFTKKYVSRFIEWFYDPDKGPFMKNRAKKWRLNNE